MSSINVLLAENNKVYQKLTKRILNNFGFEVDVAGNGREAIDLLSNKDYNIVLMDIRMPVLDGFETASEIRNSMAAPKKDIPIVAMTAHGMKGDDLKSKEVGMNDYLEKPFNLEQLHDTIANLVEGIAGIPSSEEESETESPDSTNTPLEGSINLSQLDKLAMGDNSFKLEILEMLITSIPSELELINTAQEESNWDRIKGKAHKLRSSSNYLGDDEVSATLKELEEHIINSGTVDQSLVNTYIERLNKLLPGCVILLKEEFERIKAE